MFARVEHTVFYIYYPLKLFAIAKHTSLLFKSVSPLQHATSYNLDMFARAEHTSFFTYFMPQNCLQ
jgi:hypothetical protein